MSFKNILSSINQENLLSYWGQLNASEKEHLLSQINRLDVDRFKIQQNLLKQPIPLQTSKIEPFSDFALSGNAVDKAAGKELIAKGLLGCLIIAGGQGSRLGFDGPKGVFPVSPIKHKSLFQLFAEKTDAAGRQAGRLLNLAIMTSPQNHVETIAFFEKNHYFGLAHSQISFFSQGMLPLLDQQGNLFLESPSAIAEGPDGNGSSLEHFYRSGIWKDWIDKGIRYLNFVVVDNPLADPFDAELVGHLHRCQSEIAIKCTLRRDANEKVGVIAKQNDKVVVVEYSEISDDDRIAIGPGDTLKHSCANLSLFCFKMDFIKDIMGNHPTSLPLHKAFKAVKCIDSQGKTVKSNEPMAWKFEQFIFDILPLSKRVTALVYPREECFAPLKNFSGEDSIATVQSLMQKRDRHEFEEVTGCSCESAPFEVSQEFYYPTPVLLAKWKGKRAPTSGYAQA